MRPLWPRRRREGREALGVGRTGRGPRAVPVVVAPAAGVARRTLAEVDRQLADLPREHAVGAEYELPSEAEWEYA
mgnify:CR=1 FL=1